MNKLMCAVALLGMLPGMSGRAFAGPCVEQDWQKYIDAGSCTMGAHHTFSGFAFDAGTSGFTAAKIIAKPLGDGKLGFDFTLGDSDPFPDNTAYFQVLTANSSKDMTISFTITDTSGNHKLTSEKLEITGHELMNGNLKIDDTNGATINEPNGMTGLSDTEVFGSAVASHNAVMELEVARGNAETGDAQMQFYTVEFTATPEPSTFLLVALGTIGFLGYDRRRRKNAA